jgi:acetyltransferase
MKYILTGEHFGVSRVIGLGNKIDIEESTALRYLGEDAETEAVVMYLESIKYPRAFLDVARKVTRSKPVVLLKGGTTEAGKQAAVAHTAAMASEERLVDAMLRQAGIVRIWDYTHLILMGKAFSDLCARLGLDVPELEPETVQRLQEISLPYIRMRNPVDIWAAATAKGVEYGYREGIETVLRDPNVDAVVPILMLSKETGIPAYDFIIDLARKYPEKPMLVSFSGEKGCIDDCRAFLEPRGVPTFPEIEQPFEVLSILCHCANPSIAHAKE